MRPPIISFLVFILVYGASMVSKMLRALIPQHQLNINTTDTVKLLMGVVDSRLALVLGRLISRKFILAIILFICFAFESIAQATMTTSGQETSISQRDCQQGQISDLWRKKDKEPKPVKKFSALLYPNISSNPSNGFLFGAGGVFGWYFNPMHLTKVSGGVVSVAYTTKNQLIIFIKTNSYTSNDNMFLQGDWRFYLYSQPTFGLGTNAPDTVALPSTIHWMGADTKDYNGAYPMKYNYIKLNEIVNFKIITNLYIGVGYQLDDYYSINDQLLKLDTIPMQVTPHYLYSKKHGFDTTQYAISGLSLNVLYDSRDNLINPYKGIYANINYRYNFTFLGSSQESSSLWTEFRTYVGLSKKNPRHLIAFWLFGDFIMTGHIPYLALPSLGEDQRARSGRGYVNSRFRGEDLIYGEVEYRFPILPCSQILGGVFFINATTTSNRDRNVGIFKYIQPAVGIGLRVMVNKYFRTNVNFDFAIGGQSKGFYLNGQETY